MKQFLLNNWFKLFLSLLLLIVAGAIIYFVLVFTPQKEKAIQALREKENEIQRQEQITKEKEKCKASGIQMYKQEIEEYGSGNAVEPTYNYNEKLAKCLYSGGGYTSDKSWERHVKETSTNTIILSTFNSDINTKLSDAESERLLDYWKQESVLMGH